MNHLTQGHGACLLNTLIRVPALTPQALADAREADQCCILQRFHAGLPEHLAEIPAERGYGPLLPISVLTVEVIDGTDERHPFGPHMKTFRREEYD